MQWFEGTSKKLEVGYRYSHQDLIRLLKSDYPQMSESSYHWAVCGMLKSGNLTKVARNVYVVQNEREKPMYRPAYSDLAAKLISQVSDKYPSVRFTVFETALIMGTSLTVFFDNPFWVGVFERVDEGKLSVCKVTFGAEPKDYDVWEFVLRHYDELVFSPAVETETRQTADNPKRRLRNARKQTERSGIGTRSQQALQMQREEMKTERRQISREQRDVEAQRRFEMKQMKKKEKRRGH